LEQQPSAAAAADDSDSKQTERRAFVVKAARSVAELQPRVNNVADVMLFLEVLGYTKEDAVRNGFTNLFDLARSIYEFVDILEPGEQKRIVSQEALVKVPSARKRFAEGFALSFGWLGSLVLLFIVGFSLFLSLILPLSVITVFIAGLFAGLLVTEGPLQGFNRLFSFYYNQRNLAEAKRVLKRAYITVGVVVAATASVLYVAARLTSFPMGLFEIALVSLIAISFHRVTYSVVYALRKAAHVVASFSFAFAALFLVYFRLEYIIADATTRYFMALIAALAVLSAFGFYDQFKVLTGKALQTERDAPSFFRQVTFNKSTIRSRFSVQFWETLPNYLYGSFFFGLMFGDRILSWFFNPVKTANGIQLPFVFNSAYHTGADPALLVIFPALIIQYAMMSPVFAELTNSTFSYAVYETGKVQGVIRARYKQIMAGSVIPSAIVAVALNYLAPILLPRAAVTPLSLRIMHIASVADVLLVIFIANSAFILLMNRTEGLALITLAGVLVVVIGGIALAQTGFQNLVIAYLMATASVASISTVYVLRNFKYVYSMVFSRYV
jgi:hypothetical protein